MALSTNQFFDINQLPKEEGLLIFGISMNRIGNAQSSAKNFKYLQHLDTKIVNTEGIGMVTLYADYLYQNTKLPAFDIKNANINLMINHKLGFLNELRSDTAWIKKAFSFLTFGQMIIDNAETYKSTLQKVVEIFNSNQEFREAVEKDAQEAKRVKEEEEYAYLFILEEITLFYLMAKGKINFQNEFVKNPKWVLQCYPGKPLRSEVFLSQLNPLKLSNPENKFENHYYDLEGHILYDYTNLDVETFDFE